MDLHTLAGAWLTERRARGDLNSGSARVEMTRLRMFTQLKPDPGLLDRAAVLSWQVAIGHLKPATRRRYVSTVAQFLRWLHLEGHLDADLSVHLVKVREPRHSPRGLPHRDVAHIIDICPNRARRSVWLRPAVCLMVGIGLRCCEICTLDADDYDADARTLFVRGKGGNEATLPVPAETAEVLDLYLTLRGWGPGPMFFGRSAGGRLSPNWVSNRVGQLMKEAEVHRQAGDGRTAHALRHTAAHDVLDATGDVTLVQELLRHASLATTQRYLPRTRLAKLRQAVEGRDYLAGLALTGTDSATALRGAGSRSVSALQAPDPTEGPDPNPST